MMIVDWLQVILVTGFVACWLLWRDRRRRTALAALAVAIVTIAIWGMAIDRWQVGGGALFGLLGLLAIGVSRWRMTRAARAGRAPRAWRLPWITGLAWLCLALVVLFPIWVFPVRPLPKPDGAYAVGVRTFELDDPSRKGVSGVPANQPRRLLVRIWYPAGDVSGLSPRPYVTRAEAETSLRAMGAGLGFPPFFEHLQHITSNAYENAPLTPGARGLPVLFFSHGYTSFLAQNSALLEQLASHGYMIVSIQHPGDAGATLFPNGDVIPMEPMPVPAKPGGKPDPILVKAFGATSTGDRLDAVLRLRADAVRTNDRIGMRSAATWLADRLFVHDQLQKGAVPASVALVVAAGRYDRVGEMGMSFGGATTGAVCMIDPRCAAGVNLDGSDLGFDAFNRNIPTPFLMFHSDPSAIIKLLGATPPAEPRGGNEFSYEQFADAGRRRDLYRVVQLDSKHIGITDFPLFIRQPLKGLMLGNAPMDDMIGTQKDMVLGFFDHYLRGVDNGFPKPQLARWRGRLVPISSCYVGDWWRTKSPAEQARLAAQIDALRRR